MSPAAEALAQRIRAALAARSDVVEKKMFGGYGFLLNGNMLVGAMKGGELLIRVAPGAEAEMLARPGAAPMQMGERRMTGFIAVTGDGIESAEGLARWIAYAEDYVRTLPAK